VHKQPLLSPFVPLLLRIIEQLRQIPPIIELVLGSQEQVKELAFQAKVGAQSQVLLVTVPRTYDKVLQLRQTPADRIIEKDELQMQ
jgi:uncharacterized membrane protein